MALINTLNSGISALKTFSKSLEVVGDNIANVNTTAFKGSQVHNQDSFSDILQRSTASGATGSNTTAMQVGSGVNVASIRQNFSQGPITETGLATDLAISGNGFFRVRSASGEDFVSRAGDFRLDDNGALVTNGGLFVQGLNNGAATYTANVVNGELRFTQTTATPPTTVGNIAINSDLTLANGGIIDATGGAFTAAEIEAAAPKIDSFNIGKDGRITLFMSNGESSIRGQVLMQDFRDPNALMRAGENLFSSLDAAGPVGGLELSAANNTPGTNGLGGIGSGRLEQSNVDLTQEFANLIVAQRSFQAASRIVTVSDQILEEVVSLKR